MSEEDLLPSTKIHYLSTWSVLHLQLWNTTSRSSAHSSVGLVDKSEKAPTSFFPTGTDLAYFKTRWAAEILLFEASERNIPVSIYRPSALAPASTLRPADPSSATTSDAVQPNQGLRLATTLGSIISVIPRDSAWINSTPSCGGCQEKKLVDFHWRLGFFNSRRSEGWKRSLCSFSGSMQNLVIVCSPSMTRRPSTRKSSGWPSRGTCASLPSYEYAVHD